MDQQQSSQNSTQSYPNQMMLNQQALASIASLVKEAQTLLPILRREFRGEVYQEYSDGAVEYIQVSKPLFIKIDQLTEKPLKQKIMCGPPENRIEKEIYVPNDEAIEEILSILKFMGLNQITLLTNISEKIILDDLREFECKLAALLCLKQKEWGLDKELMPIAMSKIKTIVQDARYQACNGNTIKAIQKTVSRIEQYQEIDNKKGFMNKTPYR